jgi:tagaturonate epimerase
MELNKYSLGIGDRFGHQCVSQLSAIIAAQKNGIEITPVWNKSNREHKIIGTTPADTRKAADKAIKKLKFKGQYLVDADHINISNVVDFIPFSDFFTIDVADFIGEKSIDVKLSNALKHNQNLIGRIRIPGIDSPFDITENDLRKYIDKYLFAVSEAGTIYRYIEREKGKNNFITEVSLDEVANSQSPVEFLIILSLLAKEEIPLQTIAPRFTGRFNKGIDYIGNTAQFEREFEEYLLIIDYAINEFGLPKNLKLSIHSGSDKFSIYPIISKLIKKHNKGIHVKTAGTTWLEEVIGLAMADETSLILAKQFYNDSFVRMEELCSPYAQVIDIDLKKLPLPADVAQWDSKTYAQTLRHIPDNPLYNPDFRQLIHVSYKIAVEYRKEYFKMLDKYPDIIGQQVLENIYNRHICRLFDLQPLIL